MADLSQKNAAQAVFLVGSNDAEGTESNPVGATSARELTNVDAINNGAADLTIPLTTSAVEGRVGVARRVNRKYIWMQGVTVPAGATQYILWGFSNTTQNFKLYQDQLLCFPLGENTQIWFKTPTGTGSVAFGEGS